MSARHDSRPRLVVLKVSPWSERVRWALDHHGIAYRPVEHMPFLGERRLRRLVGPGKKRATVPVLLTGDDVITESFQIARFADRHGKGPKLIPPERESEIRRWNDLADETMSASRALVAAAMLASPEALEEALPPNVPAWLRPVLRPVSRFGTKWFAGKYDLRLDDRPAHLDKLRATCDQLRKVVSVENPYLLGSFSYADIVMTGCLQGVSPVEDRYLPLGPATRRAWTLPELAAELPDLLAWRDLLYRRHRSASTG